MGFDGFAVSSADMVFLGSQRKGECANCCRRKNDVRKVEPETKDELFRERPLVEGRELMKRVRYV